MWYPELLKVSVRVYPIYGDFLVGPLKFFFNNLLILILKSHFNNLSNEINNGKGLLKKVFKCLQKKFCLTNLSDLALRHVHQLKQFRASIKNRPF